MTKIFCCIAVVVAVYRRIGVCCIDNISAGKTREIFKWTPVFRKSFQVIPCGHLNSPPPLPAPAAVAHWSLPPARSLSLPTGRILSAALLHSLYILTRLHRIFRPVRVFKNLL